jgi:HK97 family phage prohead protease
MSGQVELREAVNGKLILRGVASWTGVWYSIGAGQEEKILPSAFKRSLEEDPDVSLLISHGAGGSLPLARTRPKEAPSLRLGEDHEGLVCEADLNPRDSDVQNLRAKSENSPLEMSFAFRCTDDAWDQTMTRREVKGVSLHRGDVSVVGSGANEHTNMEISERSSTLTLEQRQARAEKLIGRVAGPDPFASFTGRATSAETCNRCEGRGEISLPCPNCSSTGEAEDGATGRSRAAFLSGFPDLNRYRQELDLLKARK